MADPKEKSDSKKPVIAPEAVKAQVADIKAINAAIEATSVIGETLDWKTLNKKLAVLAKEHAAAASKETEPNAKDINRWRISYQQVMKNLLFEKNNSLAPDAESDIDSEALISS